MRRILSPISIMLEVEGFSYPVQVKEISVDEVICSWDESGLWAEQVASMGEEQTAVEMRGEKARWVEEEEGEIVGPQFNFQKKEHMPQENVLNLLNNYMENSSNQGEFASLERVERLSDSTAQYLWWGTQCNVRLRSQNRVSIPKKIISRGW